MDDGRAAAAAAVAAAAAGGVGVLLTYGYRSCGRREQRQEFDSYVPE
jgi:hypothetical protein